MDKDKKKVIVKQSTIKNNENKKQSSYVAMGTTNITLVDKGIKKN